MIDNSDGYIDDPLLPIVEEAMRTFRVANSLNKFILERIENAFERYEIKLENVISTEREALWLVEEHAVRALAAKISMTWSFLEPADSPFSNEAEAVAWLNGRPVTTTAATASVWFEGSRDWIEKSLWLVIAQIRSRQRELYKSSKHMRKSHWAEFVVSNSRLPPATQELVFDLCQIWHDFVDPKLGLPRRDPSPSNPLLRFLDRLLAVAMAEGRPSAKTLLQYVQRVVRPALTSAGTRLEAVDLRTGFERDESPR